MHKTLKKFIFFLIIAFIFPFLSVSAYTPKQLSQYAKEISEAKKQIVEGGIEVKEQEISTVFNGVLGDNAVWNNHTVQWVSTNSENTNIKTVVWSAGSTENWAPKTIFEIASNYEKTHPGYIVVGAINGDFYFNKEVEGLNGKTYEPCNYHVQEGDVLRTAWYSDDPMFGLVGITSDNKPITGVAKRSENMYLKKITSGKTEEVAAIAGTDVEPTKDGVYIFTKELATNVDLTGYQVYEGTTTLYRKYNEGYFVKGKITDVSTITSITNVPSGTFYIATKENIISIDDEVKVEYNLAGELAGVPNVIGYIGKCLENGKVLGQNLSAKVLDGYLSKTYTRAAIGFKEDGSVVLMTVDGSGTPYNNREGTTLFQTGELLRIAGCVEGFNLDGGGSATLAARIDGRLTLINNPTDGSTRKVGNAILLVMKDPGLKVEGAIGNTITISKTTDVVDGTLENVKVHFDNKTYDMTENELIVSSLEKNMEYNIYLEYDIRNNDGTVVHGITETFIRKTEDFSLPVLEEFIENKVETNSVTFKYDIDADKDDVSQIYIEYGSNKVLLEKLSGRITIEDLDTTIENNFTLVVELKNGYVAELGTLTYEKNSIPTDKVDDEINNNLPSEDQKTGCKKDLSLLAVSLIGLTSIVVVLKKKNH